MKKILFLLFCLPILAFGQENGGSNNSLKFSLTSLLFKNYHFTYERRLIGNISFSVNYRFMPKGPLPFGEQLNGLVKANNLDLSTLQIANKSITPELRIYLGSKKMSGFYLAPYARFSKYELDAPLKISSEITKGKEEAFEVKGAVNTRTYGFMMGVQRRINRFMVLDFWLLGGSYGKNSGQFLATSKSEFDARTTAELKGKVFTETYGPFNFEQKLLNSQQAEIITSGGWGGLRSGGVSLGFIF